MKNPSLDTAILDLLLDDPVSFVRVELAKAPRFTKLDLLATDPDPHVCQAIAERADASREVLELLARDPSSLVRRTIAERADTPREVLEALARDTQTEVRAAAAATLAALASR